MRYILFKQQNTKDYGATLKEVGVEGLPYRKTTLRITADFSENVQA